MKRIQLARFILLTVVSMVANAGNFYVGPSLVLQNVSASHSNFWGVSPKLSLGYGTMSGNYYLSGEIFGTPATGTVSSSTNSGYVNTKISHSFGASFIPGMKVSDNVLGFIRLGVVNSRFTGPNTSKTGGQLGVGLATALTSKWDLRGEYTYTGYSSISGLGSPHANAFSVGAMYNFDS